MLSFNAIRTIRLSPAPVGRDAGLCVYFVSYSSLSW
jgi:hypothetical protein